MRIRQERHVSQRREDEKRDVFDRKKRKGNLIELNTDGCVILNGALQIGS
jgi:hypothetical protein